MARRFRGNLPTYENNTPLSLPRRASDYVALGVQGGGLAAAAGFLGDIGQSLIESAQRDKQAAQAAYLARVKLNVDGALAQVAADHPDDIASFQERTKKMRSEWLKQFPDESKDAMALYFDQAEQGHGIDIYKATQDRQRKENDASLLTMQSEALKRAQVAARGGNMDRATLEISAFDQARQARLHAGYIKPEQFVTSMEDATYQVTLHKALGEYERSRSQGINAAHNFILGLRQNENIPADVKDKVVHEVQKTFNSDIEDDVRVHNRNEKLYEKSLGESQDMTYSKLFAGLADGSTDRKTIDKLRDSRRISPNQAVTLYKALASDEARHDDSATVAQLYRDVDAGVPIKDKALDLYSQGLLTRSTLDRFRNEDEQRGTENPRAKQYREFVRDMVGGVRGPLAVLDGDSSAREAGAIREFNERTRGGEDPQMVADDVVKRFRIQGTSSGTMPNPRFLEGKRDDLQSLEKARQNTARAFNEGKITREQARTEADIIRRLMEEAQARQQAATAKGERK